MGNKKHSLIFLHYDPENKLGFIENSLKSIVRYAENFELIIIKNIRGYARAVNRGIKQATGKYLFILNDDILIKDKDWLNKMSNGDAISSWRLHKFHLTNDVVPDGACYCLPQSVIKRVGYFDESFNDGYGFDDTDYWFRAKELKIPFIDANVDLVHLENQTYSNYLKKDKWNMTYKNEELFRKKWGHKLAL